MSGTFVSALAAAALSTTACNRHENKVENKPLSASEQVEQAQKESKDAYDRAKKAQDKAIDEQKQATQALDDVEKKKQELAEAQQKADKAAQESQDAQSRAQQEGQTALQQAQSAQQRATAAQQKLHESQRTTEPGTGAQARTPQGPAVQTRSAQPHDTWSDTPSSTTTNTPAAPMTTPAAPTTTPAAPAAPTTTPAAPTTTTPAPAAQNNSDVMSSGQLDRATIERVDQDSVTLQSADDKSFHMLDAKIDANTKITKNGRPATIADLGQGNLATVTYRMDGAQPVADRIDITANQPQTTNER